MSVDLCHGTPASHLGEGLGQRLGRRDGKHYDYYAFSGEESSVPATRCSLPAERKGMPVKCNHTFTVERSSSLCQINSDISHYTLIDELHDHGEFINDRLVHNSYLINIFTMFLIYPQYCFRFLDEFLGVCRSHPNYYGASKLLFTMVKFLFAVGLLQPAGATTTEEYTKAITNSFYGALSTMQFWWIMITVAFVMGVIIVYIVYLWLQGTDTLDLIHETNQWKVRINNMEDLTNELLRIKSRCLIYPDRHEKLFGVFNLPNDIDLTTFNDVCAWTYVSPIEAQAYETQGYKVKSMKLQEVMSDSKLYYKYLKTMKLRGKEQDYMNLQDKKLLLAKLRETTEVSKIWMAFIPKKTWGLDQASYNYIKNLFKNQQLEIGDCRPVNKAQRKPRVTILRQFQVDTQSIEMKIVKLWRLFKFIDYERQDYVKNMYFSTTLMEQIRCEYHSSGRIVNLETIINAACKHTEMLMTAEDWSNWGLYGTSYLARILSMERIESTKVNTINHRVVKAQLELIPMIKQEQTIRKLSHNVYRAIHMTRSFKYIKTLFWCIATLFTFVISIGIFKFFVLLNVEHVFTEDNETISQFFKVRNVEYGDPTYYDIQKPKNKTKNYKLIKQGHTNKNASYCVRRIITGYNYDGMQWFNLNSQVNKDAAVTTRVALTNVTENYSPDYERMEKYAKKLGEYLRERVRPVDDVFNLEAFEEFINTRKQYTQSQKQNIIKVAREWDTGSWHEALHSREARYCAFLKDEPYPENKRPRNILAASEIVKFYMGSVFHEIGEEFFQLEQTIKLTSITDRPRRIEELLGGDGYVYVTDHSAFEAAATTDIQKHLEQIVYKTIYPELEDYFMVFAEDIVFSCGRNTKDSEPSVYFMPCSRWSGAPNTSLGNSITNYVFIKMLEEVTRNEFKFMIEGDDGLIVAKEPLDVDFCFRFAEQNGFSLKMEQKDSIRNAGFLSMVWGEDMIPDVEDPWKYLVAGVTFRPYKVKDMSSYLAYMKAKFVSICIMMPKNELFYEILKGIEKLENNKYRAIEISNKFWELSRFDNERVEYELMKNGSVLLKKVSDSIADRMHPEYYNETYMKYNISEKLVKLLKYELNSGVESLFNHAVREIIELYHTRISAYDDLTEF